MNNMTRRGMLAGACSLAAYPLVSTVTLAAAPWDARLVVIILRGGMDGLDVVQPYGEPALAGYRPRLGAGPAAGIADLDGFFGLHPGLRRLMPLWSAGELAFAHAVATPYRDKRSHFDGQDLLEAGTGDASATGLRADGWLNRFLAGQPGVEAETAFAVGLEELRILSGAAPAARWSPDAGIDLTPQAKLLLQRIYARDAAFAPALDEALRLADDAAEAQPEGAGALADGAGRRDPLAAFAASRLNGDTRIAAYSLTGWDTHRLQGRGLGAALDRLQRSILTLREGLGGNWGRTLVLALTEFGRTVAENGAGGTDHGTAGAMLLAGGALRRAKVFGRWPGLDEADLYRRRDLLPTEDVRRYAAWALRGLYGTGADVLEASVFPGLDLGDDPGLVA